MPFSGRQTSSNQNLSYNGSAVVINQNRNKNFVVNWSSPSKEESQNEAAIIESEEFFESAKVKLTEKRYKEAIQDFTSAIQINEKHYDALFYRAVGSLDFGQPQKAVDDLNLLLERCPNYRKTAFIVLSIAYRRINDYVGALRTLTKALMNYPKYIEACIARGQIYIF